VKCILYELFFLIVNLDEILRLIMTYIMLVNPLVLQVDELFESLENLVDIQ
jgi:hypothetical protein